MCEISCRNCDLRRQKPNLSLRSSAKPCKSVLQGRNSGLRTGYALARCQLRRLWNTFECHHGMTWAVSTRELSLKA
jgi:hypothetical protein